MTKKKYALEIIEDFIRVETRLKGKLKMSMVDIGERTGYTNATAYRAIKELEKQGVISVDVSNNSNEPLTITYLQPQSVATLKDEIVEGIGEAKRLINQLIKKIDSLEKSHSELLSEIETCNKELIVYRKKERAIESTVEIGDKFIQVIYNKEGLI